MKRESSPLSSHCSLTPPDPLALGAHSRKEQQNTTNKNYSHQWVLVVWSGQRTGHGQWFAQKTMTAGSNVLTNTGHPFPVEKRVAHPAKREAVECGY